MKKIAFLFLRLINQIPVSSINFEGGGGGGGGEDDEEDEKEEEEANKTGCCSLDFLNFER